MSDSYNKAANWTHPQNGEFSAYLDGRSDPKKGSAGPFYYADEC